MKIKKHQKIISILLGFVFAICVVLLIKWSTAVELIGIFSKNEFMIILNQCMRLK